eukprot:Phypoly_transcript_19022.p1 GENE.Phypoly_transcript_19022~~Phypoly_transcript_19022.p1  ORF type:complete len:240 (+),score=24.14 Phypoly_transcript_19022:75-722(+)
MGTKKHGTTNGEKKFWRTRLIIIISLSIVIIFCSYAASGNIFLKAQHVTKLYHQDASQAIIYVNNPQIELEINKIQLFLYVDVALKSLLLLVCISLIVVVCYALKMKNYQEEQDREGLLEANKQRADSIVGPSDASINMSDVTNEVVKEGIVYEPYTEAMLKTLADDESKPAFTKVSNALYTHGPMAANKMLFMLEKNLAPEETQYLLKTLSERK